MNPQPDTRTRRATPLDLPRVGLSRLTPVEFHARLSAARAGGGPIGHLAGEAVRRARERLLTLRDLRLLLLGWHDLPAWRAAREAALAAAAVMPGGATSILTMQAQLDSLAPPTCSVWMDADEGLPQFAARASYGTGDDCVTSPVRTAPTKPLARGRASVAVLAQMSGLDEPCDTAIAATTAPSPAVPAPRPHTGPGTGPRPFRPPAPAVPGSGLRSGTGADLADTSPAGAGAADSGTVPSGYALLDAGAFRNRLLRGNLHTDPGLRAEALWRAQVGLFDAATAAQLLHAEPQPSDRPDSAAAPDLADAVNTVRRAVLETVAVAVGWAPSVLGIRLPPDRHGAVVRYEETAARPGEEAVCVAVARLEGGVWRGQPRTAGSKKAARHAAAVHLLAHLVDLPEPDIGELADGGLIPVPGAAIGLQRLGPGMTALSVLHSFAQRSGAGAPVYTATPAEPGSTVATTVTLRVGDVDVQAVGRGAGKAAAKSAAALALLRRLTGAPGEPGPGPSISRAAGAAPRAAVGRPARPPIVADPDILSVASGMLADALADGCAMVFDAADPPRAGRMLVYRTDGTPMPDPPWPGAAATRTLVLADPAASGIRSSPVAVWSIPVAAAVRALAAAPPPGAHPAACAWSDATRAALRLIAERRIRPGLTDAAHDAWYIDPAASRAAADGLAGAFPPHGYCLPVGSAPVLLPSPSGVLRGWFDAVADAFVRTSGARLVLGPAPYAAADIHRTPGLRGWADAVEDVLGTHGDDVALVLRLRPPDPATGDEVLTVRAYLGVHRPEAPQQVVEADAVWAARSGGHPVLGEDAPRRVRRALRRAAAAWPPLARLALQERPHAVELSVLEVLALRDAQDGLADAGLRIKWPPALVPSVEITAVVGRSRPQPTPRLGTPDAAARIGDGFRLDDLLDFRWQLAVDGTDLTDAEMDELAESARPLVRIRDRWVLLDARTTACARHRNQAAVTGADALAAALAGRIQVDGSSAPCRATGGLADLVEHLRAHTRAAHPPGQAKQLRADKTGGEKSGTARVPVPVGLTASLRDYQHRALDWLDAVTRAGFGGCLADDMGLGKTLVALAFHLHLTATAPPDLGPAPTLVVAPASLVANWARESARFTPGVPVVRYHGSARSLEGLSPDTLVVTTYALLVRDLEQLAAVHWGLVVADEAQHAKNPRTTYARALRAVPARTRLALTGTPVENGLTDLWTVLDFTTPGLLGPLPAFRQRFAAGERDPASEATGALRALIAPFLLRRRKTDAGIAPELPPKTVTEQIVALTPEQAALYEAVVRETMAQIRGSDGIARRGLVLKLIDALKQICNAPQHYLKERPLPADASGRDIAAAVARSGKLQAFDELITSTTAAGASTLVFTQYVELGRQLDSLARARGIPSRFLHGGTPARAREQMVEDFQQGRFPVFVLSVKAAGTGLNLQRATHVLHVDRLWNPTTEDQASDRAYRIGQTEPVQVHVLSTEGTVEDRIGALLDRKRALADAVLGSAPSDLASLSDDNLAALVALAPTGLP